MNASTIAWQDASIRGAGIYGGDLEYEFAETDDPRLLAVIHRDDSAQVSELYDGDAINPIIYVEHRYGLKFSWVAGYDGGEAELMQRAYDQWGWDSTARRWLWIFHGIAASNANGGYDRSGNWIVATSTEYRKHVGAAEPETYAEALEDCAAITTDLSDALDGDVYGVGWAVNKRRLDADDEPIDPTTGDWMMDIECWGLVGEKYAKTTAFGFEYGEPKLPPITRWLRFKFWLGDKLIEWGRKSNFLGRWGKTVLKAATA